jgi:CYTH domain-containing protein
LGIDVFNPPLDGLILAEAEFVTDTDARAFSPPDNVIAEITNDPRFTGGRLAVTPRDELLAWLRDYEFTLTSDVDSRRSP